MTSPVHAGSHNPVISIITVVRNAEQTIEKTVVSVLGQIWPDIEYIVIDGASTDATLGILGRYRERISCLISEPDRGIYDGMNKGLDAARGRWIFFLGADDVLFDRETIAEVAPYLSDDLRLVFGNIQYTDGKKVRSRLSPLTLLHNTVHHQSAFYHAGLFDGWRFDKDLRLIADYELNLIVYLEKKGYRYIDRTISTCSPSGLSRSELSTAFSETNRVRAKHIRPFGNALLKALYTVKFGLKH